MYENFAKLLEERNLKAADVCRGTGLPSSLFSEWKRGKSTPKADKLNKIANFFNVPVEYFMPNENDALNTCRDCGFTYCISCHRDIEEHNQLHSAWYKAVDKFGKLYCYYPEREKIKAESRNIAHDTSLQLNERCEAQLEVFRCLFSRSVEATGYDLRHISFETYVSMMLKNESYRKNIEDNVYVALCGKYGVQPGINSGTYYYIPEQHDQTIAAHKDNEIFTPEELQKIEEYKRLLLAARPKD